MADTSREAGNSEFSWDRFDSESYFQHYYGEPHPDDDQVIKLAVAALKKAGASAREPLDVVDVGTGPNFIPLFAALPVAAHLTAWEYSKNNVDWLRAELAKSDMRSQWQHFWGVTRASLCAGPDPGGPDPGVARKDIAHARLDLRSAGAALDRRDDVLLRGINHLAHGRV